MSARKLRTLLPGARTALGVVSLVLLLSVVPAATQTKPGAKTQTEIENLLDERASLPSITQPSGVAQESVVDPAMYFVGPSDLIAVNIWTGLPQSHLLSVTPEGSLIVPLVGEIAVAGKRLSDVKSLVTAEVRKKYVAADITVTLSKPRPVIVMVTGTVLNPGLYTLTATDRANKAIDEADKLTKLQEPEDARLVRKIQSVRNILVRHRDGTEQRVDVQRYFATHDGAWNPYLREGDVVVVPRRDPAKNVIGVYGQVNAPGRFEFVQGDRLSDALRLAEGFTALAVRDSVTLTRLSADARTQRSEIVDVPAEGDPRPNPTLEPGDRIVVRGRVDTREDYNVDVKGEVRFPGTYPITLGRTRLSEVVREAGGFTELASLASATVLRQTVDKDEVPDEEAISKRGLVSKQDTLGYGLETSLRLRRGAVTVDFDRLFSQGDSSQDVVLQAEDEIVVPRKQITVYVFGQVSSPGHVAFEAGREAGYYVQKAGGYADRASRGDVKIVKAKTRQWLSPGDTAIEPGDYVWVPASADHDFSYYMTITSQAASILSVIIGVGILIVQVSK